MMPFNTGAIRSEHDHMMPPRFATQLKNAYCQGNESRAQDVTRCVCIQGGHHGTFFGWDPVAEATYIEHLAHIGFVVSTGGTFF